MAFRSSVTMRGVRLVAAMAGVFLLSACSTLTGGGDVLTIYDLAAPDLEPVARKASVQLLVPLPSANDALAGNRIVVREKGATIAYLGTASWSDQLPALVQSTLVRAFENAASVRAVGKPGQSLAIDDQLIIDIRAFELDVTGSPQARVVLGAKLLDDRSGKVRGTRVFEAIAPASSDQAVAAVAALNAAAEDVTRQIVAWTGKTL